MKKEKLALYGIIGAALIGLIGVLVTSTTQTNLAWIPATQTAQIGFITQTARAPQPRLILGDTFDDNGNGWEQGSDISIVNGALRKTLTTDSGGWSTVEAPGILESNFCLIFDAKMTSISDTAGIVVVMRATNYDEWEKRNYVRLSLSDDGNGTIWIRKNSVEEQRIAQIEGPLWSDNKSHTVQISMQDNVIEILELNSGRPSQRVIMDEEKLILEAGIIRLGLAVPMPNQNATVEFDNFFLYNKCL